jgi:hypothetical protein
LLCEHKLFLNSRKNFNDPYDCHPVIDNDLSAVVIRDYVNKAFDFPFNAKRSAMGIARILEMKSKGTMTLNKKRVEEIKEALRKNADCILDETGHLSFSLTADNPLLWGHYAASFAGICAVFKRSTSLTSAFAICAKVKYVNTRPHLPLSLMQELARRRMENESHDELANQIFFRAFLHKSDHWSYEEEARIFYPFHAFQKLPFDPVELVGFILGPRSSAELEDRLRREIKTHRPGTSLERSSLSKNDFHIIVPHKFARQRNCAA